MKLLSFLLGAVLPFSTAQAAAVFYGPIPYHQRSDSPFYPGLQQGTLYLEDFEDQQLNTPFVSMTVGHPGTFQDVDEDDGKLDGLGMGHVWFSTMAVPGAGAPWGHEIIFSPNQQGQYPLYAGFALLGFNPESLMLDRYQLYQFFDSAGNSLSPDPLSSLVPRAPDDTFQLSSVGDRFVGAYSDLGISRILIGNTSRFDHLQYGYSIPEPAVMALVTVSGVLLFTRRRRNRTLHFCAGVSTANPGSSLAPMNARLLWLTILLALCHTANAAAVFYGPIPYHQKSDSPFFPGLQQGTLYLEDFEEQHLSTPSVSMTVGHPGTFQDVDEDDGKLNGLGMGHVWFSTMAVPGAGAPWGHEIVFSPNQQGQYPLYAGFALLGFNPESLALDYYQSYQFFDSAGNSLSPGPLSSLVPRAPDDTF